LGFRKRFTVGSLLRGGAPRFLIGNNTGQPSNEDVEGKSGPTETGGGQAGTLVETRNNKVKSRTRVHARGRLSPAEGVGGNEDPSGRDLEEWLPRQTYNKR